MKKIYIFLIFIIPSIPSLSQVDKIRSASQTPSSDSYSSGSGCGMALALDPFIWELGYYGIIGLIEHHRYLSDNKESFPKAFSIDLMQHISINNNNQYNVLPRIRGNWGVLSTDFQYNILTEFNDHSAKIYNMMNWQIIQLNFIPDEQFAIRFGTGVTYDRYAETSYNEYSGGFELNFMNYKFTTVIEGRYSWDYRYGRTAYGEAALLFNIPIIRFPKVWGFATFGGLYQNYYDEVEIAGLKAGLTFNLH